jgi:hypothetical protein
MEVYLHVSSTAALDEVVWSVSHPGRFTLAVKVLNTHWIGGRVDLRADMEAVAKRKKSLHFAGNGTRVVQH